MKFMVANVETKFKYLGKAVTIRIVFIKELRRYLIWEMFSTIQFIIFIFVSYLKT